jgi:hypothetical protein
MVPGKNAYFLRGLRNTRTAPRKWPGIFCRRQYLCGIKVSGIGCNVMIIKVGGYTPIKPGSAVKKRGATDSASSFSDVLGAALAGDTAPAAQMSDISALNTMLSMQEISEEEVRRQKLVQQGRNMLDTLELLRQKLLAGGIPAHMMIELERQLSVQKQSVADPALKALIDDIELRLAVELAKLENALAAQKNKADINQ